MLRWAMLFACSWASFCIRPQSAFAYAVFAIKNSAASASKAVFIRVPFSSRLRTREILIVCWQIQDAAACACLPRKGRPRLFRQKLDADFLAKTPDHLAALLNRAGIGQDRECKYGRSFGMRIQSRTAFG